MEKSKKIKIIIGLFYLMAVSSLLIFFLSKFSLNELTSYKFIQVNHKYFYNLKESNLILLSLIFLVATIIWVFAAGFGSPVALLAGFVFGKWIGTLITVIGLSIGATSLYIFANYFFKDLIKENFLHKFKSLESKFKKNEFTFFLFYRFVGGIPFQIANILPVLFNVNIKNYFIGTVLGITPSLFIMVSLGSGIESFIEQNENTPSLIKLIMSPEIYIPIISFLALVFTTIIIRKFFYKN